MKRNNKNWDELGLTLIDPVDQFKNSTLSYDRMNVDWEGNKFNEKIVVLLKYKDDSRSINECKAIVSRGYNDFEKSISTYISDMFGLNKEDLVKQVYESKHIHIKNDNGESYIITTDPSPLITEFWASRLMRFTKPEYSKDEIFYKIDSALELLAE